LRTRGIKGEVTGEYYPSTDHPFSWNSADGILTVGGANFRDVAAVDLEVHAEHRGYSSSEDSYQQYRTNPEHDWVTQSTLVDVTNETDSTIYYYVDADTYKYHGYQIDLDCAAGTVTATVEASFQDDGTAQASCAYQDVTNALFGVASLVAAAGAASAMWVITTPFPAKFLRVKVVYNTGGNTGDATIYHRGAY
jgi:hypothetical protein